MKARIILLALTFLCLNVKAIIADAGNNTAPNPGERVLIMYVGNGAAPCSTYSTQMMQAWTTALGSIAPPPVVDLLQIPCGDRDGFYDQLNASYGVTNLSGWCEVYDLRFLDLRNNLTFDGVIWEDTLTYVGANNDAQLFTDFLNQGGHLYLQGEHHDYYARDTNMIGFINTVASTPMSQTRANVFSGDQVINTYNNTPENFSTDFNTLSGNINGRFVGSITKTRLGSGRALVEINDTGGYVDPAYGVAGGQSAVWIGWLPSDLNTNGRMVVGFETNGYTEAVLQTTASTNTLKNIYDFLSACWNYTITKTFIPTTLCVGDTGRFTLCYNNTGNSVPSVTIWDTVPSQLTVSTVSPAATGGPQAVAGGNLYWWTLAPLAAGASGCITVNFTVNSMP